MVLSGGIQQGGSRAVGRGVKLIVVDNTNTMAWEMKPYITLAVNNGYKVHMYIHGMNYVVDISLG